VLLLAESGATKTEWRCLQASKVIHSFQSGGFNPNTQPPHVLSRELTLALKEGLGSIEPLRVRFYGAGLGHAPQRRQVLATLQASLPFAQIEVYHDLLAAVHSTGLQNGMLGILGTGSNACRFIKGEIVNTRGGLGYLLGDEGSGMDLSRTLVKSLMEGNFPQELTIRMWNRLETDKGGMIRRIYSATRPHYHLSSLMPSFTPFLHEPAVKTLIISRFLAFLDTTICLWPDYRELPLCMVGAISHHLRDLFAEACTLREVHLEKVDPSPIEGLVAYYQT